MWLQRRAGNDSVNPVAAGIDWAWMDPFAPPCKNMDVTVGSGGNIE
jgi:hypothetical protein